MKLIDKNVSLPSTLSRLIEALNSVHKAVSTAIALAVNPAVQSDTSLHMKYVAHVWNGTIHLMGICSPLQALGFEANVLPYMKLCVLALDKIVQLCTTAHCSWRVHIYLSIAACYDARKHFSKRDGLWSCALSTLDAALARVMQLKKEEELDAPVPEVAKQILTKAEEDIMRARFFLRKLAKPINSASQTHSSKTASPPPTASSHLTLSVTKEEIESTFSRPKSRVLAVIHVLNNLITSTAKLDLLPDFGEKSVASVNPSDIDGILLSIQPYMSDETVIQVEDQVTLLKILFRYRKWSMFEACYASAKLNCEAQSQVVAQEELKLIFSLYELLHDRTDQARLNGVISLLRLAHRKRHLCHMMHDTLSEVMLYMWYEFAKPALEILDKNLSSNADEDVDLRKQSSRILLTLHLLSDALHFDDITWRSIVSLRLAILIKADQPRLAIQILRSMLEVLCTSRDSIAGSNLQVASTVDDRRAIKQAAFSGCFLSSMEKSKDLLVPFPGAQFQQTCMNMTLASIQTDMTYLLYDLEYLLVSSIDGIGPKMITTRLATECNRNGYTKCILNLRTAIHDKEDQRKLFLEAMATLDDMKHHDELLLTYVPEKYSTLKCERPSAPAIISRGTTFVTLEVLQYYNEKPKVAYYCVYGKETGAGTDVSLNNMEYPGTGSIIFPSPQPLLATISGLQPNESYVFAVAAFDANDQVIGGIGATSLPVVTLNPLMLHFCYGILAKEAFISGERSLATKAANVIYSDYVTSACFKIDRWRLNPLYTHALKFQKLDSKMISNQYTQSPMQTLHMFFSAILILVAAGSESYDVDNLVRIKNEPRNVLPDQIQVIETVNKGMIALEIACLTEQANYICTISHKLYNLMVPLLLLKSSNGLLLQPLCSIIEALLIVPREQWDENIYRTYICASFEILKIASEKSESIAVKHCLMPDSPSSHFNQVILHPFRTHCKQASGLREVVFIRHKWITGYDGQHGKDCAPEGEKPKKTTPRDDKAGVQSRCDEVLISNTSPAKAFVELKTHFSDHKDFVKFACLLLDLQIRSGEKIPKGVFKEVCWQPSLRLSSRAIEVLVQLGASQLYQRENENTAGQIIENIEQTSQSSEGSSRLKEIDVQDMDVYLWSGEVYFLSGYSLHLSLSTKHEENVFGGPDQDLSWFYLASSTHRSPEAIQMEAQPAVNEIFLDMAKASQLFFHAQAWVKLQSCMECVWNTLWKAWISPLCFEKMYDWKSLYICTMRAMDMLDILKNERSYDDVDIMKRSTDSVDSGPHLLMTSTDVAAKEPSIGISWIAKVVSYTLQALCAVGEWKHLVLLGKRAHFLTGGEFGDCFLPWVVFAQTQRCELQDTVVENSKYELATYVKEYEESQLKKKKKKSRLVIHEVVTEEERHYLEERSRMEVELNKMAEHQKVLKDHLSHLMSLMDHSVRAKSMCLQSLHRAQKSVAKSLTYQESSVDILTHFKSCVSLCRQKRSTILLVQTLQETGDYYFAESDISAAKRTWNDGIDAVFGSLTAATHWRDLINDLVVDGDGTWCVLMCYNMLGKLIWTSLHEDLNQRLENALHGSAILCKLFSGSLSHPNPEQQWSFAEYTIRTDIVLFSHRPLRYIHPANVMLASTAMIETLLSNEQYIHALPLASCMDYFASCHFLDARGSIQAKRMKAEACIGIGRMDCVCTLLNEILNVELVLHQSKRIGDPENEALHKWLLEFSVSKTISEIKFGSRLACLLCLTILRWIFTLGCNENSSPQGIALKHIAAQAAIQLQAMVQQGNNSNIASEEYGGGNDKPTPRAPDTEKTNAIPRENHDQVQTQDKLKIECECDFILSALSLEDGLTDSARETLQSAMQKCKQTVKPKLQEVHFDNVSFNKV
ncbi:hypothetical protein LEN26_000691 [Aphanomyces euteiches]|nr:hypothetical protein LEN26_000691 [Aphanomyces euteiches]